MSPLPTVPYNPATLTRLRLYRDCHPTFERAYYSAPFRLVGQELWVPGAARTVDICADAIGPATTAVVGALLEYRPEHRLRSTGRLVRLAEKGRSRASGARLRSRSGL
ncbi:MAG: hypothetical protein M1118_05200 [Chloroflexi bacterium]|nr:hypothetical protein [Chloroflexota bacterium]